MVLYSEICPIQIEVSQLTNDPRNYSVLLPEHETAYHLLAVRNLNPKCLITASCRSRTPRQSHPSHHGDEHHGEHNEQKESKHDPDLHKQLAKRISLRF